MTDTRLNKMRYTEGRFFGIEKRNGEKINAQLVSESPHYVTVHDRNLQQELKLAKASIVALNIDGATWR